MDDERFPPTPTISPVVDEVDRSWVRTAVGAALVLFGVELLIERLFGVDLHLVYVALGLVLLGAWFRTERRPFLITGCLITGSGAGMLVESVLGSSFGFVAPLGIAAGFRMIYALSPADGWARIGFVVSLVVAAAELGSTIGITDAITSTIGDIAAPLAVIILGTLVVARRSLAPRTFMIGAAAAGCFGLIALGASGSDLSLSFGHRAEATRTFTIDVPDLDDGTTLAIENRAGTVTVRTGPELEVVAHVRSTGHDQLAAERRAADAEFDVEEDDGELVVELDRDRHTTANYEVTVPAGTAVRVDQGAGNIHVELEDGDIEANTRAGNIEVTLDDPGRVVLETGAGNISVSVPGDPRVRAHVGVGRINLEGFGDDLSFTGNDFAAEGDDGDLDLDTGAGMIEIKRREATLR